jgi:D-alanyl-D-alanine carboxypeptidase
MPVIPATRCRAAFFTFLLGLLPALAHAQVGSDRYASIVIEARTGNVLFEVAPDESRYPASLTKMMTLYMVFEALREGRISRQQAVPVSAHAASMLPSKIGLVPGSRITVEQAILALITKSANDAAAALGEMLGGTEARFAQMMTLRARSLGMTRTVFRNASGWPDPEQVTTARDMALLGRRLVADFPVEYQLFSTPSFRYGRRTLWNHNRLLNDYEGADGIKTGYTGDAGYNLVASALRGNVRLVGVVLGGGTAVERNTHMMALLDRGFERMDVPVLMARTPRMPGLVSSAEAASTPRLATARPRPTAARAPQPWTVQVGAVSTQRAARTAATTAARRMNQPASAVRVEDIRIRNRTHYRAQVTGLTQTEATRACAQAARRKQPCAVIRPEPARGMASR